jgi:hypothetical protein
MLLNELCSCSHIVDKGSVEWSSEQDTISRVAQRPGGHFDRVGNSCSNSDVCWSRGYDRVEVGVHEA